MGIRRVEAWQVQKKIIERGNQNQIHRSHVKREGGIPKKIMRMVGTRSDLAVLKSVHLLLHRKIALVTSLTED